jgi:probable phosphoglycerate mutase
VASESAPRAVSLVLIRHGETEWNAAARIQGFHDIALSQRGREQAQNLAQALADEPIAAVYSSDLERAIETARPVAQRLGLDVRKDARVRERGFGIFEGHTYEEAEAKWPNEYAIWKRREPGYALPKGGESYLAGRTRVFAFLEDVAREHAGSAIAVITHGGVLDIVFRAAHGIPWETPRSHLMPNACINRVTARLPGPVLEIQTWGDAKHLV